MIEIGLLKYNCTTCKYSDTDQIGDRYCINDKSEHCADFVSKDIVCELWEGQNGKQDMLSCDASDR